MNITLLFLPAFLNLGGGEIFMIVAVVLMLFGSKRIPELARGIGKGMREVKDAMSGVQSEITREITQAERDLRNPLISKEEKKPEEPAK